MVDMPLAIHTGALRDSLATVLMGMEDMVVMVMARDLPSQVTMAVVTLTSTSPVPTIMEIMVMTFTTLTTQDMDMARGQLNLDTMDTAMVLPTAISMSPDITQTMALKFTILTKYSRLSERDCTFNNVSRYN